MIIEIGHLWHCKCLCLTPFLLPFFLDPIWVFLLSHNCSAHLPAHYPHPAADSLGTAQEFLTPASPASTVPCSTFPLSFRCSPHLWPKTENKLATDFPLPSLREQTWGWCSSPSHESVKEVLVPPGLATVSLELLAQLMPISEKRLNRAQEKCYRLSAK